MADTVEFTTVAGQVGLTLKLYPDGDDNIANGAGDSCTEASNRIGLYTSSVTGSLTGIHSAHILLSGGSLLSIGYVYLANDDGIHRVGSYVEALLEAALSEHSSGAPPATPTPLNAIMYIYMALRNKIDIDSSTKEFHNDAGSVIWKKALTDTGSTYTEAEGAAP